MSARLRYDGVAMTLHWAMAAAILGLLASGFVMIGLKPGSAQQFQMYQTHKSVGITVLALTLLRLGWRLAHRPPSLPDTMPAWEQAVAHAGHWALYGLMLAMPLAGWAVVSTSPYNIATVLYGLLPLPHLPLPRDLNGAAKLAHLIGAWLMVATLLGHVGAALRHHLLLKDEVMARMLPRFRRDS
ncbi:cytochrome B [Paramagnetospirillum marisnigri]|uniref:Cytochrome B n=1 Tax=Paramagnetospirillum marisnigri TaxID=1285242 RepID=A0A178MS87_9PROT|nr:cytochrome b [Paramagnetospirillum marisnigri]OAN51099.1 cytochrome B [Paramagnetospirillum marisnigri]